MVTADTEMRATWPENVPENVPEKVPEKLPEMMLVDLLTFWPHSAEVFWQYKMHCPGCPFTRFHTVQEACREHRTPTDEFLVALAQALRAGPG